VGGQRRNCIARLNADGSLDTGFNPNAGGLVYSLVVQTDGKILLGGDFTAVGGATRYRIARLNADGTVDSGFNPVVNNVVFSLALQADGKILLGGYFTTVGGTARYYIARLNADSTLDTAFNPNANNSVCSLALQADGKILVGGYFGSIGVIMRNYIARLNADGTLDSGFNLNSSGYVNSIAAQADGKLLLGGSFTNIGGLARTCFARVLNDPAVQTLVAPDLTRLQWLRGGTAPEVGQVTFELSNDGGVTWTAAGAGARISTGWEVSGVAMPLARNFYVRARGRTSGAQYNGSSGLIESVAQVYVPDLTPPIIACPGDQTVSADIGQCYASAVVLGTPIASDNSGSVTVTNDAPAQFSVGTNVVTWTAVDPSGNSNLCTQLVIVRDTQPPNIACLTDVIVNADVGQCYSGGVSLGAPLTSDNCAVVSVTNNAPGLFPVGTNIVTWTATDTSGNTNTCAQIVVVRDMQSPSITCPVEVTVNADAGQCYASGVSLGTPVTSDNCGVARVMNNAPTQLPVGTNVVTWTATDVNGNMNTCVQLVMVRDVEPPVISYSFTNLTLSADANCRALMPDVTGTNYIQAADVCSSSVTVTQMPTNNAVLALGTNEVVLAVADGAGNTAYSTNTVVVADTTAPVITVAGNDPLTNECRTAFVDPGATATDYCSGVASLSTNSTVNPDAVGVYTITYFATDGAGNSATNTRTVYVLDTVGPVPDMASLPDATGQCSVTVSAPAAHDACDGPLTGTTGDPLSYDTQGTFTVHWNYSDSQGNSTAQTQKVIVQDTAAPVILFSFTNLTLSADASCQALMPDVTGTNYFLAVDDCGGPLVITQTPTNNAVLMLGINEVVLAVADGAGNTAYSTNTVVVADTTAPVITVAGNDRLTNECYTPFVDPGATATDTCSGVVSLRTNSTVNPDAVGVYTITYIATDAASNSTTNARLVHVVDTTAPVITNCAPDQTVMAGFGGTATLSNLTALVVAGDPGSSLVTIVQQPPPGVELLVGTNAVTFFVDDGNGNTNTCVASFIVNPAVLLPTRIVGYRALGHGSFQLSFTGPDGQPFRVLASTNAMAPLTNWTMLTNGTFPLAAPYIDALATNAAKFYRISSP
jgi:uncharacterized delta-60 repeat protein